MVLPLQSLVKSGKTIFGEFHFLREQLTGKNFQINM